MAEPYIDLITGKPIEPWMQEYLERKRCMKEDIEDIVQSAADAFRKELRRIMRRRTDGQVTAKLTQIRSLAMAHEGHPWDMVVALVDEALANG